MSVALAAEEWNAAIAPLFPPLRLSPSRPRAFLAGLLSSRAVPKRAQPTKAEGVSERDATGSPGPPGSGSGDFGELFRAYRGDVERVGRRRLGESAAQAAASEGFLRAQRGAGAEQHREPAAGDLGVLDLAHPGPSPLRQLAESEQRREILDAIDSLPRKYRLPITLRYYEELDYAAIAELLCVERTQVGTLLFRAKQRLRAALSADQKEAGS